MPFLVELRAVMDWVWTDTTLSLSNWMCVEDIYANIFIIKCSRETEKVPGPEWEYEGGWGQCLLPAGANMPRCEPHGAQSPHQHEGRKPPWARKGIFLKLLPARRGFLGEGW